MTRRAESFIRKVKIVKKSPIHLQHLKAGATITEQNGWGLVAKYGEETAVSHHVTLTDVTGSGLIRIEGETATGRLGASDLAIGESQPIEGGMLYMVRRDLLFVRTGVGGNTAVYPTLTHLEQLTDELITVTDVTNGHCALRIAGEKSAELLSYLCGLDFHDSQFGNSAAKISSVAKTRQLIIRHDQDDQPAYYLFGGRSFGAYLWDTILEAGQHLDLATVGLSTL